LIAHQAAAAAPSRRRRRRRFHPPLAASSGASQPSSSEDDDKEGSMSTASLLGAERKDDAGEERLSTTMTWLDRVVDTAEAHAQLRFAVPMVLTNMAYYGVPLVSVMFSGHLGDVPLAGATLGNSWATVTGYAFVVRTYCPLVSRSLSLSLSCLNYSSAT
jgi:multidrug resistance protein, MATE family